MTGKGNPLEEKPTGTLFAFVTVWTDFRISFLSNTQGNVIVPSMEIMARA